MLGTLRLVLRSLRLVLWLTVGALAGLVVSLLALRRGGATLQLRQRLMRAWLAGLVACLPFRVRVHGQRPAEPVLWVSNHVSWCDIALLGALQPMSFLSKAEVRQWPLAGWLAVQAGTLFIRRGAGDSADLSQQIRRYLRQQRPLLLFPEGTTTDGRGVRAFHGRLLASVLETRTPVQPVALLYRRDGQPDDVAPFIGDDELLGHLLRLLRAPTSQVEIHLLPLIYPQPDENRSQLARRAQQAIGAQVISPASSGADLGAAFDPQQA
ncbi:MAG: lysophospholipid acyltransferase family protein [Pseudomonas sp.]|uniref:lysophospholipid acyltransferase family protein n=1 Tax=Pseudomonas sp. TaxID=306 RepID=UPI003396CA76